MTTPAPPQPDDASARWRAFVAGDAAAFETLFRQYYPRLFDYGRRFTGNHALLDDTLQELFTLLWQQRPPIDFFPAYVYRAFRNRLLRARDAAPLESSSGIDEAQLGLEDAFESQWIDLEEQRHRQEWLRARVAALSKRQQEVLYLRFFQEQPIESIASILRIHPQSVRNLLHEALKALRQTMRCGVWVVILGPSLV